MPKPADPVDSAAAAAAAAAAETVPKSTSSSKSEPSSSSPNPIPRLARADLRRARSASPPRGASSAPIPSARSRSPNKLEDKSLARAPGDRLLCRRPSPASAACNAAFPSGSAATSPSAALSARGGVSESVQPSISGRGRPRRRRRARLGRAWANAGVDAERTSTPTGTEGRGRDRRGSPPAADRLRRENRRERSKLRAKRRERRRFARRERGGGVDELRERLGRGARARLSVRERESKQGSRASRRLGRFPSAAPRASVEASPREASRARATPPTILPLSPPSAREGDPRRHR